MRVLGERSIASKIQFVLGVTWWAFAVGLGLLACLFVASFLVDFDGHNLTMDLPVSVELKPPVQGSSSTMETNGRLERLSGNLRFPVRNGGFLSLTVLLMALLLGGALWVISQLRRIFRSLSRGEIFLPENARRTRWVGVAVIGSEFARSALLLFSGYYTSQHFTADGMRFVVAADISGVTILSGFALLVIAEVYREAIRLHDEQSLTI